MIKKARLTAALLALGVLCAAAPPLFSQTSYFNAFEGWGDFETDWNDDGIGDGWETWYTWPAGTARAIDRNVGFKNQRSQRVEINYANAVGTEAVSFLRTEKFDNPVRALLRAGSRIQVSFRMKTSATVTNLKLRVIGEYGTGDVASGGINMMDDTPIAADTSWKLITLSFQIPPGVNFFRLMFRPGVHAAGPASGTLWFDDVVVTDGRPAIVPKRSSIKNWALYAYTLADNPLTAMERFSGGRFEYSFPFQGIRNLRPDGLVALITRVTYTGNNAAEEKPDNVFNWPEMAEQHSDWLLTNANGEHITLDNWVAVDIGNPDYQAEWLRRTLLYVERMKLNAIFFDAVDAHAAHVLGNQGSTKYPTDAEWQAAVTSFLQAVCPPLRAAGVKTILNMAHTTWYQEPGITWLNLVDGTLFEIGVVNSDPGFAEYDWFNSWKYKFLSQVARPEKIWIICNRAYPENHAARRFGMASYLLGANENSYHTLCANESNMIWHPELDINLGDPTENYQIVSGAIETAALFRRTFQNGLVLVNPSDTQSFNYNLTEAYKDLDGTTVGPGTVTMTPKKALILLRTAQIKLTLSASRTNPKPGDTVTYTLVCSNVGRLTATNVNLTLPIPSDMTVVAGGISNGGVLGAGGTSVSWQLAQVHPGVSVSLTCIARVK